MPEHISPTPTTSHRTAGAGERGAPPPPPLPPHHHLGLVGLVAAGGVAGTAARYGTSLWLGNAASGLPTATLTVNLVGCFLLGLLLEALGRRGPETPRMQQVRLGLGTGVMGGFTTFSSLAEELAQLVHTHADGVAALYAVLSVVGGLVATMGGITLAAGHHRLTSDDLPEDPDEEEQPPAADRDTRGAGTEGGGERR